MNLPTIITKNLLIGLPNDNNQQNSNRLLIPRKHIKCNFLSIYKTYKYEIIHQQSEKLSRSIKTLDTNRNLQEQDRYNLIQQIRILRIALTIVSAIAFISLILSIIALCR